LLNPFEPTHQPLLHTCTFGRDPLILFEVAYLMGAFRKGGS
jgi:hypothetical protein